MLAVREGAQIIDGKDPSRGALGALPHRTVREIVRAVAGQAPVSATIGDLPPDPETLAEAVRAMAGTGVDMVKIGIFDGGDPHAAVARLATLELGPVRLVGLLLADRHPDFALIERMAQSGFAGVMLDTAAKTAGALPDVMEAARIEDFVRRAHAGGLFAGLAGALRRGHIAALAALRPDVLGFRGALCSGARREGPLEGAAVRAVADDLATYAARSAHLSPLAEATP